MRKFLTWLLTFLSSNDGFAKLVNNPLGDINGSIGHITGGKWKDGIRWIRSRIFPTQRGTIQDNRNYLIGINRTMSYKQMNIRRAVMQILGHIGRMNMALWIDLIWQDYCNRHGLTKLSGINLMIKNNVSRLYNSMPNIDQIFNATTNTPDLTQLLASKGDLEAPVAITSGIYTVLTGDLTILFAPEHYTNGADTDLVYAMVAKKPILDTSTWEPKLFIYPPSRGNNKTRTDGTISLVMPAGLAKADLVAYLFFKDAAGTIGFSDSLAIQVT